VNQRRSSPSRTPARPGGTSTGITVVLVVVTALLGIFILKKISDDSGNGGGGSGSATTQPVDTSADTTTSSAVPVADMAQAKILVANGAGVKGLAGSTTTALQGAFPTATYLTPTDANAKYQASAVYYQPGFEGQAGLVATSLGLTPSGLFPPALPLADPTKIGDANILVLLGADKAGGVTVTPPVQPGAAPETTVAGAATTEPPGSD
jgi:LytR cell envelope-related transcriptional attenuator